MQAAFAKRAFYILCFVALNIIDFLRTTQDGDGWSAAANATGLVVLALLTANCQLRAFRNVFSVVCPLAALGALAYPFLAHNSRPFGMYLWAYEIAVINIAWLCLLLPVYIRRLFVEKSLSVKTGVLGVGWAVMMLLMGFSVGRKVWPFWFLLIFGMFYMTQYTAQDMQMIKQGIIDGTLLSFLGIQAYAYGFRPYDELRYIGAYSNSNNTSLHYLIVYMMILFKLHIIQTTGDKKYKKVIYFVLAAGVLGLMFMTMGRTSWVTAGIATLFYGILVVGKKWKKNVGGILIRGAVLGVAVVLLFPAVFASVRWLPTILHHPIWYEGEYSTEKVHSFDPPDSYKYIELDEFLEAVFGRIIGTFRVYHNPLVMRAYAAEQYETVELIGPENMDLALRIRASIYTTYWNNLKWNGHLYDEGHYEIEGTGYHSWHAQNVWLQMAYTYGIPAGILFVGLTVLLLVRSWRTLKNSDAPYSIIPFFVWILFFVYGIMEVDWNVGQYVLVLLFIVQHPQLHVDGNKKTPLPQK